MTSYLITLALLCCASLTLAERRVIRRWEKELPPLPSESEESAEEERYPSLRIAKTYKSSQSTMDKLPPPEGMEWMGKTASDDKDEKWLHRLPEPDSVEEEYVPKFRPKKEKPTRPSTLKESSEEVASDEYDTQWKSMETIQPAEHHDHTEDVNRRYLRKPCLRRDENFEEQRTYPRSFEHAGFEAALPREWDWRNVSGVNYCSPNRNQHIPVYCGSCWVFGSLGALNDRFNIARKNRWPMTMISPQEIIDCNGKGTCQGGAVSDVYGYAKTHGLVEEGCNNYRAVNGKCDPFHRCGSCWPDNCFAIENYTRYYINDFGKLSGRENMMAEIHNRGPLACAIGATQPFELNYTSGVYQEYSDIPSNHIVSVSGWGVDRETNTEYWIVRNSWGDAWGEKGWFRVVTSLYQNGRGDLYNMGIERECYFADPDVSNLD